MTAVQTGDKTEERPNTPATPLHWFFLGLFLLIAAMLINSSNRKETLLFLADVICGVIALSYALSVLADVMWDNQDIKDVKELFSRSAIIPAIMYFCARWIIF